MRYEAITGFNTKQVWIYDNKNNSYIDPPTFILEAARTYALNSGEWSWKKEEEYVERIANEQNPDWLHDGNEYFSENFEI